jgi:hypothetical protein
MTCGDRALSLLAVVLSAVMGWQAIGSRERPAPPGPESPLEVRVTAVADAIARAEGYYARGEHDGRSLLHRLNNPGGLKKPALHAEALPTWKDTGLVWFPTAEMGWAALRHQVRLMLTGRSRIYDPSDSLLLVAMKYADGDTNWGWNVAEHLGVSPGATLADLAPPIGTTPAASAVGTDVEAVVPEVQVGSDGLVRDQ